MLSKGLAASISASDSVNRRGRGAQNRGMEAGARGGGSLSREIGFRLRQQARVPRDAANRYGFSTRETLFPRLLDLH